MNAKKRAALMRGSSKVLQGYDQNPPKCSNCTFFMKELPLKQPNYRPPMCNFGKFSVKPGGVCDCWEGTRGEVLE